MCVREGGRGVGGRGRGGGTRRFISCCSAVCSVQSEIALSSACFGFVFKAHRLSVSLNSRLESNKEDKKRRSGLGLYSVAPARDDAEGGQPEPVLLPLRERESVLERESVCVRECVCERDRVYVCVRERVRVRERVCAREREREKWHPRKVQRGHR